MKILASLIKRKLKAETGVWGHCAIYEDELQRLWPLNEKNRKQKIEQFANEYGFHLSFYKPGLCAIFEREPVGSALNDHPNEIRYGRTAISSEVRPRRDPSDSAVGTDLLRRSV